MLVGGALCRGCPTGEGGPIFMFGGGPFLCLAPVAVPGSDFLVRAFFDFYVRGGPIFMLGGYAGHMPGHLIFMLAISPKTRDTFAKNEKMQPWGHMPGICRGTPNIKIRKCPNEKIGARGPPRGPNIKIGPREHKNRPPEAQVDQGMSWGGHGGHLGTRGRWPRGGPSVAQVEVKMTPWWP